MDYGAHLKKSGVRLNAKSAQYAKQARFSGSRREARGAILRALAERSRTRAALVSLFGAERRPQMKEALEALVREGFIEGVRGTYRLAD